MICCCGEQNFFLDLSHRLPHNLNYVTASLRKNEYFANEKVFYGLYSRKPENQIFKLSGCAPGSPRDNAVAESFFASIKKEDFHRNCYKTEEEFRTAVKKYTDFYNDYRPHQRLGFLTPNQAEKEFYNATAG